MALVLNNLTGHPAFTMTADDIVATISEIHWPGERAQAMAALADHLVGAPFDRVVDLARADTNLATRALVLLRLALASGRSDLTAEALDAATKGDHRYHYTGNTHIRRLSDGTSLDFPGTPVALPYGSKQFVGALLASIAEIGTPEADAAFMTVLQREDSLSSIVEIIRDLPGPLARIVGEDGVGVLVGTLRDIVRWWP